MMKLVGVVLAAITLLGWFVSGVALAQDNSTDSGSTILVLDASRSIWGKIGEQHKVEIAREAVAEMVGDWDANVPLGLIAYGHRRKADCSDIEMLIAPQQVDTEQFVATANALNPTGKTPLSQAVIDAATALKHTEQKATVILISDGKETCALDPCLVGAELEALGVDFTAHVIGFDVPEQDQAGLRCLARETGGVFIQATNTSELEEALHETRRVSVIAEELKLDAATINVPESVHEGSTFTARWTGPKNPSDYLVIRSPDRKQRYHGAAIGAAQIGPEVELIAPADAGDYIVNYEVSSKHQPLGQASLKVVPAVGSLDLARSHEAGSTMSVEWTGPGNSSDGIFVYKTSSDEALYRVTARANDAKPASIDAPDEPGEYELRLQSNNKTLASASFSVVAAKASVKILNDNIRVGEPLLVDWEGPRNKGDRLTIAEVDSPKYLSQRSASGTAKSPIKLRISKEPGNYEVRLQTSSGTILAKQEFTSQ